MDRFKNYCQQQRDACEKRLEDVCRWISVQFISQEKAIKVASDEMNRRLEGMNEFREQLNRQAGTFVEKNLYEAEYAALRKEIELLREWKARSEGATSWSNIMAVIALIVSMIAGILNFMFRFNK
jgi:hypothetical protein